MKRVFVFEYLTGTHGDAEFGSASAELLPAGLAMRDAIVDDLLRLGDCRVSVAVSEQAPLAFTYTHADTRTGTRADTHDSAHHHPRGDANAAVAIAPRAGETSFDFIARQAALHDLSWIVAPETDGILLRACRAVAPARWLGCSAAAIRLASSKRATLLRLAGRGLLTPLAFERAPGVTRWVVKPDDGAGAVATHVHAQRAGAWDDWQQRSRAGLMASIEPWVDGDALSLSLLCANDGVTERTELLSINRQQVSVDTDGALTFAGVEIDAVPLGGERGLALATVAAHAARALPGLRGYVGIDLVWHPVRGPVLIEVNPRVTSAYVGLSAALGRNLAADVLATRQREAADADA